VSIKISYPMLNKHSILCVGYYTWKPRTSYVKSNSEFQNYEISFTGST
jgi:hypothetical protein